MAIYTVPFEVTDIVLGLSMKSIVLSKVLSLVALKSIQWDTHLRTLNVYAGCQIT